MKIDTVLQKQGQEKIGLTLWQTEIVMRNWLMYHCHQWAKFEFCSGKNSPELWILKSSIKVQQDHLDYRHI